MTKMRRFYAIPYVFWLLLFVIAPVLLIVYQSFFDMDGNFSLVNYQSYLGSGKYLIMTLNSVWYAFLITLITYMGQFAVKSLCLYWYFWNSWQRQSFFGDHGCRTKTDFVHRF